MTSCLKFEIARQCAGFRAQNKNPSTDEANLGQKEAEAEKQKKMPTGDETRDANLGQKEADRAGAIIVLLTWAAVARFRVWRTLPLPQSLLIR